VFSLLKIRSCLSDNCMCLNRCLDSVRSSFSFHTHFRQWFTYTKHVLLIICEWQAYAVFDFAWNYALPVLIFVYCYGRIFYTIRRQSKVVASHVARGQGVPMATTSRDVNTEQVQQQAPAAAAKLSRTEMNVLKTMIAVIICFILCWAPASFTAIALLLTVWSFHFCIN